MFHNGLNRLRASFMAKRKQKLVLNDSIIVLTSSIIIISLYCLTQPRLGALFFNRIEHSRKESFIANIVSNRDVNPWTFWEFRDLIGYGGLRLFDPPKSACELKTFFPETMVLERCDSFVPWISYESNSIESLEGLLENTLDSNALQAHFGIDWRYEEIVVTPNLLLYGTKSRNEYLLVFLEDLATMSQVNGPLHFEYRNEDFREKYKQFSWVVITKIKMV